MDLDVINQKGKIIPRISKKPLAYKFIILNPSILFLKTTIFNKYANCKGSLKIE